MNRVPIRVRDRLEQKTLDGLNLKNVAKALERLLFVRIKTNDPYVDYIAKTPAFPEPCILSKYTNAREEVVPWVKNVSGYKDSDTIYLALQEGGWN
ncbi:Uncharacterised protein [uncultured archaeon]|nr:Uncharacterised protein [uncultured archaeon]